MRINPIEKSYSIINHNKNSQSKSTIKPHDKVIVDEASKSFYDSLIQSVKNKSDIDVDKVNDLTEKIANQTFQIDYVKLSLNLWNVVKGEE